VIVQFTPLFRKDRLDIDNSVKIIVDKRVDKIIKTPLLGKPLGANYFSERFDGWRITYKLDGEILCFLRLERRDKVYDRGWG
jgi:mRNA-degrading endonuclease RelE of RelBE toxin-antitoxin system